MNLCLRALVLACAFLVTAFPVCARMPESAPAQALDALVEDYYDAYLELNPVIATRIGDHRFDDRLGNPAGAQYRARRLALEARYLDLALQVPRKALNADDQLTLDIFLHERRETLAHQRFPEHLMPLNQLDGLATELAVLGSGRGAQPFRTVADYDAWLARAGDFPVWVRDAIDNMRQGMAIGVTVPRIAMAKVLPQIGNLVSPNVEDSVFYAPLRQFPATIPAAERERLEAAFRILIETRLNPAYRTLRDFIANEYLPHCRHSVAWEALPDGAAWYRSMVLDSTSLDRSPDQIHAVGLREVARIRTEMDKIRRQVGFKGDLAAFFTFMREDPRFYFSQPDALLEGFREIKLRIDAKLPALFSMMPKSDYEIRPIEAFRAEASPGAFYEAPSEDGARPGVFYVNTTNLKAQPSYGMETLSLHEASPGHHFQISLSQEQSALPRFRRFGAGYNAYVEGWALYSESIGRELGLFTDPYQYFGRLNDEMLRAMRLVVDTGLHHKGWSRERAIAYMAANSTMAPSDCIAEVERYMVWPAQALSYKLGQLSISALRARAQAQLGSRFDIRAFHREVLKDGAMPIPLLEAKIERWVRAQQG